MTTEKRGSEKLLDTKDGLCSLTAEELLQVAGMGPLPIKNHRYVDINKIRRFDGVFPNGEYPPELFRITGNMTVPGTETGNPGKFVP